MILYNYVMQLLLGFDIALGFYSLNPVFVSALGKEHLFANHLYRSFGFYILQKFEINLVTSCKQFFIAQYFPDFFVRIIAAVVAVCLNPVIGIPVFKAIG